MDRSLKMLTFLLWVFLLSQSHSLVESLQSDQPDRVSFLPNHHDKSTPPRRRPPKKNHHGSPKPPQEPRHPPSGRHHPPPRPPPPPHQKETRPQDQQRQNEGRKKRKMNSGKKIGVIFLGIGVALQVVVVGVLGFKRWQISKKMKERRWDFTA